LPPKKIAFFSVALFFVIANLAAAQEAQYCNSLIEDVRTYAAILDRAEQRRLSEPCGSCEEPPESRVMRCKAAKREAFSRNAMVELQDEAKKRVARPSSRFVTQAARGQNKRCIRPITKRFVKANSVQGLNNPGAYWIEYQCRLAQALSFSRFEDACPTGFIRTGEHPSIGVEEHLAVST
jgi:hypothetical protein